MALLEHLGSSYCELHPAPIPQFAMQHATTLKYFCMTVFKEQFETTDSS